MNLHNDISRLPKSSHMNTTSAHNDCRVTASGELTRSPLDWCASSNKPHYVPVGTQLPPFSRDYSCSMYLQESLKLETKTACISAYATNFVAHMCLKQASNSEVFLPMIFSRSALTDPPLCQLYVAAFEAHDFSRRRPHTRLSSVGWGAAGEIYWLAQAVSGPTKHVTPMPPGGEAQRSKLPF